MIYLETHDVTIWVMKNKTKLFVPCEFGLKKFLSSNKLTMDSRIRDKTAYKLLKLIGADYNAFLVSIDIAALAVLLLSTKNITKIINKNKKLKTICENVYKKLQNRDINPSGSFDNAGRFYSDNKHLIECRTPSRSYPYSELLACRTHKHVKKCALFFNCKTEDDLLKRV